jgi:hypothetical protein
MKQEKQMKLQSAKFMASVCIAGKTSDWHDFSKDNGVQVEETAKGLAVRQSGSDKVIVVPMSAVLWLVYAE